MDLRRDRKFSSLLEMTSTTDINVRPRYRTTEHKPEGARDKRGRPLLCQKCPEIGREGSGINRATWVGTRRPTARLMDYPFALCDECWIERRWE